MSYASSWNVIDENDCVVLLHYLFSLSDDYLSCKLMNYEVDYFPLETDGNDRLVQRLDVEKFFVKNVVENFYRHR